MLRYRNQNQKRQVKSDNYKTTCTMRLAIEGKQQNTIFRKCFQLLSGVAQHRLDNSSMSIGFLMNHDTYMQGILCFIDINISRGLLQYIFFLPL
jgi:hypothetical protein